MIYTTKAIQLLLSVLFGLSAVAKILALPGSMAHRQRLGVPLWLWRGTGIAQALGVAGLLLVWPRHGSSCQLRHGSVA